MKITGQFYQPKNTRVVQGKLVARAGHTSGGTVVRDGEGQWHGGSDIYIKLGSSPYAISARSYKYYIEQDAPSVTLWSLQPRQGD